MMVTKARAFSDQVSVANIMKETDPVRQKQALACLGGYEEYLLCTGGY